jgi:hypothetical protein
MTPNVISDPEAVEAVSAVASTIAAPAKEPTIELP